MVKVGTTFCSVKIAKIFSKAGINLGGEFRPFIPPFLEGHMIILDALEYRSRKRGMLSEYMWNNVG